MYQQEFNLICWPKKCHVCGCSLISHFELLEIRVTVLNNLKKEAAES